MSGDREKEPSKKGWKKVFGGGGKGGKKMNLGIGGKSVNGGKKKKVDVSKRGDANVAVVNGVGTAPAGVNGAGEGAGGAMATQTESGFVGMGKDGVWISRKNFLKT